VPFWKTPVRQYSGIWKHSTSLGQNACSHSVHPRSTLVDVTSKWQENFRSTCFQTCDISSFHCMPRCGFSLKITVLLSQFRDISRTGWRYHMSEIYSSQGVSPVLEIYILLWRFLEFVFKFHMFFLNIFSSVLLF
jgi:hypothetical protein